MSKSSRNNGLHKESCRLVGRQLQRLFWMDLWGKPEIGKKSRRLRVPFPLSAGCICWYTKM